MSTSIPNVPAPVNARIAAQETQIIDLVKRTQEFEREIRELQEELASEKDRGLEAVKQIRDKWRIENQQWHEGHEYVQGRHRLARLDILLTLENERGLLLENKELLIQEKAARLVKEYEFTVLQTERTKLLFQIGSLEDEVDAQREELAQILMQHETELVDLKIILDRAESRLQEQIRESNTLTADKRKNEIEISELKSSSKSFSKQVDRLSLQVDNLRTQNATLEARNKELQHQIDKWQSLEGKGEKEMEEHRIRRIESEVRIKELEFEVERMEKDARGAQKKVSKLEAALLEAQEQIEQTAQDLAHARLETIDAAKEAAKWEQEVEQLKTALETERIRTTEFQTRESERTMLAKTAPPADEPASGREKKPVKQIEKPVKLFLRRAVPSDRAENIESSDPEDTAQTEKESVKKPRSRGKVKGQSVNDREHIKKANSTSQKHAETDIDEQPARKKRRKINMKGVFANPPGFSFAQTGDAALDIPSVLSPVKEGQQVPPRFGTLGSTLRF